MRRWCRCASAERRRRADERPAVVDGDGEEHAGAWSSAAWRREPRRPAATPVAERERREADDVGPTISVALGAASSMVQPRATDARWSCVDAARWLSVGEPVREVDDPRVGDLEVAERLLEGDGRSTRRRVFVDPRRRRLEASAVVVAVSAHGDPRRRWERVSRAAARQQLAVGAHEPCGGARPRCSGSRRAGSRRPALARSVGSSSSAAAGSRPARAAVHARRRSGAVGMHLGERAEPDVHRRRAEAGRLERHETEALGRRRVDDELGVPQQPVALVGWSRRAAGTAVVGSRRRAGLRDTARAVRHRGPGQHQRQIGVLAAQPSATAAMARSRFLWA